MRKGWLNRAGKYRVTHMPMPHPFEPVNLSARPKGVQHTIEGSLAGGLAVFRRHYTPTFSIGRNAARRVVILQHVPLGYMAMALENHSGGVETNRDVRVQIEMAGKSKRTPWLPDDGVLDALAELYKTLRDVADIPLRHVAVRRDPELWEHFSGWLGHIDVPENAHWDSGALRYGAIFKRVADNDLDTDYDGPPEWHQVKVKPKPRKRDKVRTAPLRARARVARPVSCHSAAKEAAWQN